MDVKLTTTETDILSRVMKVLHNEATDKSNRSYQKYMQKNHSKLNQKQTDAVIKRFVDLRDSELKTENMIAKKLAILLHFYRTDGVEQVSLLELFQQVFLEDGQDYNDIKLRKLLEKVMKYFAVMNSVKMVYATTDKSNRILFAQEPTISLDKNQVKVSAVELLPNGQYEVQKNEDGSYFCFCKGHRKDGITLNKTNYKDFVSEVFIVNKDSAIKPAVISEN